MWTQRVRFDPVRFGRGALLAMSLAGAAVLAVRVPQWSEKYTIASAALLIVTLAALTAVLAYVGLRGTEVAVRRTLLELGALGITLLALELAVALWKPDESDRLLYDRRVAERLDIPFDARRLSKVVLDLRRQGIDAYPGIGRQWGLEPQVAPQLPPGLYPLSHASDALIVECNEHGRYLTYRSDDWGFNNPAGLLDSGDIDIALVGESYILGHCLPAEHSLAGRIRQRFPRTANLGMASTTTLTELGSFREYVEPLEPRIVVWAVNPHFIFDREELQNPVLRRYLEPTYSQHLIERQPEVDRLVREISIPVQAEVDQRATSAADARWKSRLADAFTFPVLREQVNQLLPTRESGHPGPDLSIFLRALQVAKDASGRWGGQFIVLLTPLYAEVVADQMHEDLRHAHLAREIRRLGIPVIDGARMFKAQPDPAGLFTMRTNNHPTAEGYALLADAVLREIRTTPSDQRLATR